MQRNNDLGLKRSVLIHHKDAQLHFKHKPKKKISMEWLKSIKQNNFLKVTYFSKKKKVIKLSLKDPTEKELLGDCPVDLGRLQGAHTELGPLLTGPGL